MSHKGRRAKHKSADSQVSGEAGASDRAMDKPSGSESGVPTPSESDIRESRTMSITKRVVTLHDVRKLADVVMREYTNIRQPKSYSGTEFSAKCADQSTFESTSADLFLPDSILVNKQVHAVHLRAWSPKASVEIDIDHGDYTYTGVNEVRIVGNNRKWVNGTLSEVDEIIIGMQPQENPLERYGRVVHTLLALTVGLIGIYLVWLIPMEPSEADRPAWAVKLRGLFDAVPILRQAVKYLLAYAMGYFPAWYIVEVKLKPLWPSVELQIGPEHTFIEKRRRKCLGAILALGVVPTVVSLTYDVLKSIVSAYSA